VNCSGLDVGHFPPEAAVFFGAYEVKVRIRIVGTFKHKDLHSPDKF
jgi:hypothetical protein